MKSQLELWSLALEELGDRCSVSTATDLKTIRRRHSHEGDKLFTVTLPAFGKEFERSLDLGHIPRDGYVGWARRERNMNNIHADLLYHTAPVGGSPKFLGGFMDRVFDKDSAALFDAFPAIYDRGCIDSVQAIRQLTLMFGKLKALPGKQQIESAYKGFVETESQITAHLEKLLADGEILRDVDELKVVLRHVFGDSLVEMERFIYTGELNPRHGPGATADYKLGNQKYYQQEWTDRLEGIFPYLEYALPNHRYHQLLEGVTWLSPEQERPVRVVSVPKTAKTPRIIAIEPTCMQYMQQAVSARWCELLERPRLERPNLASYFVGFTEQWPNQAMAQIGSEDGSLATLDLSEASDRVPNWLVEAIFEDYPWFSEAIQVCRTLRADVPGHGIIPLTKYASMGSALTFPVEAVVFATVSLWAIAKARGQALSRKTFTGLRDKVRVYGDDIIVPTDCAVPVVHSLENFGFVVNRAKSFWTGRFRESCGKEYYRGDDVSIVRYRQPTPTPQACLTDEDWVEQTLSTVSTRNQFYTAGMWVSAAALDDVLHKNLRGFYPYVGQDSPVLGRFSFLYGYDTHGMDQNTQSPFVKGFVPFSVLPRNEVAEEGALLKCLLSSSFPLDLFEIQKKDDRHLTHSGRPRVVGIKLAKAPPF